MQYATTKPPFRADHVGSLLRPAALKQAREQRAKGEIDAAELKAVEDREIERRHQEAGRRRPAIDHRRRIPPLLVASRFPLGPRRRREDTSWTPASPSRRCTTRNEGVKVTGKLGFSGHPMIEHFKFVKAHTERTPKMTIPAPSALYGRPARDADRPVGLSEARRLLRTISARPTRKRCAPSPMPAAAICSSTRCSSPCCAIRNTASR